MNIKALDVAYYWSPRETAAILDYLDRLRWELYGDEIIELRQVEDEDGEEPISESDGNAKSEYQQPFNIKIND